MIKIFAISVAIAVVLAAPANGLPAIYAAIDEQSAKESTGPLADALRKCLVLNKAKQKGMTCSISQAPQDTTLGKIIPASYHPHFATIKERMGWGSPVTLAYPVKKLQVVALWLPGNNEQVAAK